MKYILYFSVAIVIFGAGTMALSLIDNQSFNQMPLSVQFMAYLAFSASPYIIGGIIFILFVRWVIKEVKKPYSPNN